MVFALFRFPTLAHLHIGALSISPHGVGIAIGFLLGAQLMQPAAAKRGITEEQTYALLTRAAVGALVGARLAYVVNHAGDYTADPLAALRVWEGGISLLGGVAGGVIAALPRMRSERLPFWTVMDAAAPGLALGIAVGRIGDLIVGDHLGKATSFALGFDCRGLEAASPCAAGAGQGVHLPALYDLVSVSALLVFLLWLRRRPRAEGVLILTFAAWYGTGRIIEDFFRVDVTHGTGLTGSQWASVAVILAIIVYVVVRVRSNRDAETGAGDGDAPGPGVAGSPPPEGAAPLDTGAAGAHPAEPRNT